MASGDQDKELVRELLKLQIRQTEILNLLVSSQVAPQVIAADSDVGTADNLWNVGDKVRILNPTGIRIRRDTICTVVKVGKRITSLVPNGYKVIRAPHNLERVV